MRSPTRGMRTGFEKVSQVLGDALLRELPGGRKLVLFSDSRQDAAKLSGDARYAAYGKLDVDLMRNLAPWAPMHNGNTREFISNRVTNYIYHPVYAAAILNALAVK